MMGSSVKLQTSERIIPPDSHANRAIDSDSTGNTFALLVVHPLQNVSVIGDMNEIARSQAAVRDGREHIMDFTLLLLLSNMFMACFLYLVVRLIWQE
jgi:hypothetical protein